MFDNNGIVDDVRIINKRIIILVSLMGVLAGLMSMMFVMDRLRFTSSKQHRDVFKLVNRDSMRALNKLEQEVKQKQRIQQNENDELRDDE